MEQLLSSAAASVRCCCTCGVAGQPVTNGMASISSRKQQQQQQKQQQGLRNSKAGDESTTLRFCAATAISFADRAVRLRSGGFACGKCRALMRPGRLVHAAAFVHGGSPQGSENDDDGR